jgi:Pyridoxamine 5'-phosphate oxidase
MIEIDEEIRQAVNGAFESRNPVVLGYVGDDGAPHLSFRGSTQVLGKDQLAVWVRNPDAGLPKAIRNHPRVTLLYRSSEPRRLLTFKGRARIDPSANDIVYASSPKGERDRDPEKKGVALIIDLDEVFGFGPSGPIKMTRS